MVAHEVVVDDTGVLAVKGVEMTMLSVHERKGVQDLDAVLDAVPDVAWSEVEG